MHTCSIHRKDFVVLIIFKDFLKLILDVWIHTQYFLAQNLFLQAYGADDDRTLAIKGEVLM